MAGELGEGGEFIYEEGLCAPPCTICGFVDRRLRGEWCSHYIGMVIDNCLSEGPFANEFEALWVQANQLVADADDPVRDQLEQTTPPELLHAIDWGSLDWLMTVFPNAAGFPDYDHPASSGGFVLYDLEPLRFETVMAQFRDLITTAQALNASGPEA